MKIGLRIGLVLRMLGPIIQVICIALLFRHGGRGRMVLGFRVEYPLYAGFAAGLVLVLAGLFLVRGPSGRPRRD